MHLLAHLGGVHTGHTPDCIITGKSAFGIMGYIHGIKWVYTISAWYMTFC
jgi:hypothetical protein